MSVSLLLYSVNITLEFEFVAMVEDHLEDPITRESVFPAVTESTRDTQTLIIWTSSGKDLNETLSSLSDLSADLTYS